MQRLLLRRILRGLKKNWLRYMALLFLVALSMFLVVGVVNAALSTIRTIQEKGYKNRLEDGSFTLARPLEEEERKNLEQKGIQLEKMFSLDFDQEDTSVLRVMENRKKIDQVELAEGRMAAADDEIVLERIYGQAHELRVGDQVTLAGKIYTVTGFGTSPDYELCVQSFSDIAADGSSFGTAFCDRTSVSISPRERTGASGGGLYLCFQTDGRERGRRFERGSGEWSARPDHPFYRSR